MTKKIKSAKPEMLKGEKHVQMKDMKSPATFAADPKPFGETHG